jgi:succinyl-CoA synthetase beta subunit
VDALEVITSDEKVDDLKVPLVVRLDGTNSEEGLELLEDADLPKLEVEKTMLGAAERVVEMAAA